VGRFILRYRGDGRRPDEDAQRIASLAGVEVIDDSVRMLLVEGAAATLRAVLAELPDWVMVAERVVPLPDVRRRRRRRRS